MSITLTSEQEAILQEIEEDLDKMFREGVVGPVHAHEMLPPISSYDDDDIMGDVVGKHPQTRPLVKSPFLSALVAMANRGYLVGLDGIARFGGAIGMAEVAGARPDASEAYRGVVWFTPGGVGVADDVSICLKGIGGGYSWRSVVFL